MKNSLIKRAIAAAAAVPLALTQSLALVNADDAVTTTANNQSTLQAFLAVPGDADIKAPGAKGAEWNYQQGTWEQTAKLLMEQIGAKDGSIDLSVFISTAVAKAGQYSDVAEKLGELLKDKKVSYAFDGSKITIKGTINEPNYNEIIKAGMSKGASSNKAPKKVPGRYMAPDEELQIPEEYLSLIPEGYDVEKLKSIDVAAFEKKNPGFIDEVINSIPEEKRPAADVVEGLKSGEKTIADLTNEQIINVAQGYVAVQVEKAFSSEKLEAIKVGGDFEIIIDTTTIDANQTITAEFKYACNDGKTYNIGELPGVFKEKLSQIKATADEEIQNQIDAKYNKLVQDEFDKVADKLVNLATKADNGVTKALKSTYNYSTTDEKDNVKKVIAKANAYIKQYGFNQQLPPTATDIASNSRVAAEFAKISNLTDGKVSVSAEEVGKLADSLGYRSISKDGKIVVDTELSTIFSNGIGTFTAAFDDNDAEVEVLKQKIEKDGYQLVGSYKKVYATVDFSKIKTEGGKASLTVSLDRVLVTDTTTTTTTTTTSTTTSTTTDTTTTTSSDTTTSTTTDTTTTTTSSDTTTSTTTDTTTTTSSDTTSSTTTTTTTPVKQIKRIYAKAGFTTTAAFYLNTEEQFNKDQISDITIVTEYTDDTSVESKVSADDINFGTATPSNTYKKDSADFKYDVQVYVKGDKLNDADGNAVTVEAYIGVRGDADLNSKCDAVDASTVLVYYATLQTGGTPNNTQLSDSKLVTSARSIYDEFAAYLCDVQHDVTFNNLTRKSVRNKTINAIDATAILQFYSSRQLSANASKTDAELWTEIDKNTNNKASEEAKD